VTFRPLDSATLSCRTFPACIRRNRADAAAPSSCERICCFRESALVLLGFGMAMTRSELDVEKRTTTSRGVSADPLDIAVKLHVEDRNDVGRRVVGKLGAVCASGYSTAPVSSCN
jgi:hypothetical protein